MNRPAPPLPPVHPGTEGAPEISWVQEPDEPRTAHAVPLAHLEERARLDACQRGLLMPSHSQPSSYNIQAKGDPTCVLRHANDSAATRPWTTVAQRPLHCPGFLASGSAIAGCRALRSRSAIRLC